MPRRILVLLVALVTAVLVYWLLTAVAGDESAAATRTPAALRTGPTVA